jgi:cytoskeletal protein CcmA (bactofilin family)
MFKFSKRKSGLEVTKLTSLIAPNVEIRGDVVFSGGLRVDGRIHGNVRNESDGPGLLVLSEHGSVTGNVEVHDAVVNGTINGDLAVGHFLELQARARVSGNISYRKLQMECGAAIDGRLQSLADSASPAAATPASRDEDRREHFESSAIATGRA